MNYSFEDALLDDEDLEKYQDFIYDITDFASLKGRNSIAVPKKQVIENEDINFQNGVCASPQNAFTWSTKEKNEFNARWKTKKQKRTNKIIICGKPIESDNSSNSKPVTTVKCVNNLYGPGTIKARLTNSYDLETISVPRYGPDSIFEQSISEIKGLYGPCQQL